MPDKPRIPEVLGPEQKLPADLVALQRFAWVMDEAVRVPGTPWRVGLDAALGLVPGIGDAIGGVLSAWIVVAALRHRVPKRRVVRMVFNIVADVTIGSVPVVGDAFDFLWEENVMNLELLLRYRDTSRPPRSFRQIGLLAFAAVAAIALAAIGAMAGVIWLAIWLAGKR